MELDKKIKTIKIQYDRVEIGNMLIAWGKSYKALIDSSEKIIDLDPIKDFEIFRVKLMLRGMAVESLLKALAISRKTKLINSDGTLHKDYRKISHDLVKLAKQLKIKLSDNDQKMLNILTDSTETGRYPFPMKELVNNRFWIVPTYENQFNKFLENTIDLINIETAKS